MNELGANEQILSPVSNQHACTEGWVNFSEFEITVCGIVAKCQKTKLTIFNFFKFYCFAKILNRFSTPLHSKKNKLHFRKRLKTVLN